MIGNSVMWTFDKHSNKIAFICEDGSKYTYAELQAECSKLISAIGSRSLVFVLCCNEKGALLGYTAMLNGRIVPVMLDAELNLESMNKLLTNYKPDFLWVPSVMYNVIADCHVVYSAWGYVLLKTPYTAVYPLHDELALLLTTSGSTGSPKFVRQSYANINANTTSIVQYLELDENERPITTLPMNYTYGLSIINTHLAIGASIILTKKMILQKDFWSQLCEFEATSLGGVPYTYEMLNKMNFYRMDVPFLRTLTQAGGKLSLELHKKISEYAEQSGKRFIVMYGQTEATARMSYLPSDKTSEKCGSIGIAIPGGKFSLVDTDGNIITEPEKIGELIYKGVNVTLGYAVSGRDLVKGDENNGVLITGDMAKKDSDGYYYIVGRKKRFLKIFGDRINLDEMEQLIKAEFPETDCACGGSDDKLKIYITNDVVRSEISLYLIDKISLVPMSFDIVTLKNIPRSDSGKVFYAVLGRKEC